MQVSTTSGGERGNGVVECKSAQLAVAREELVVQEHKSRQCAEARRREEENDQ